MPMLPLLPAVPSRAEPAHPILPFHTFIWKIASRCNLNCTYCFVYNMADQRWREQPAFMSDAVARQTRRPHPGTLPQTRPAPRVPSFFTGASLCWEGRTISAGSRRS